MATQADVRKQLIDAMPEQYRDEKTNTGDGCECFLNEHASVILYGGPAEVTKIALYVERTPYCIYTPRVRVYPRLKRGGFNIKKLIDVAVNVTQWRIVWKRDSERRSR